MSSGGSRSPSSVWGSGLKDQWNDFTNAPLTYWVDHAVDANSGGLVKYDSKTGQWSEGTQEHFWDEVVGSMSGRNKARDEGYQTDKDLKAAEAKQQQNILDNQLRAYRTDVAASQAAAGITATARSRAKASQQQSDSLLGANGPQSYLGQS